MRADSAVHDPAAIYHLSDPKPVAQLPLVLNVVGPVATGGTVADLFQEYVLTATHAPVSLVAGKRYWIEISNSISGCEWFWEIASEGNRHSVQDGGEGTPVNGYDLADTCASGRNGHPENG